MSANQSKEYKRGWHQENMDKVRAYRRASDAKIREWIREEKLRVGCAHCGYAENASALEHHHILPRLKGAVSGVVRLGLPTVKAEIERCIVLCSNCHSIVEYEKRKEGKR